MSNNLRKLRKESGLTLRQAAVQMRAMGVKVSYSRIQKFEQDPLPLEPKWEKVFAEFYQVNRKDITSNSTISRLATVPLTGFITPGGIVELIKENDSAQKIALPEGLETAEGVYLSNDPFLYRGFYLFTEKEMPGVPAEFLGYVCVLRVGDDILARRVERGSKPGHYHLYEQNATDALIKDAFVLASALMIGTKLKRVET